MLEAQETLEIPAIQETPETQEILETLVITLEVVVVAVVAYIFQHQTLVAGPHQAAETEVDFLPLMASEYLIRHRPLEEGGLRALLRQRLEALAHLVLLAILGVLEILETLGVLEILEILAQVLPCLDKIMSGVRLVMEATPDPEGLRGLRGMQEMQGLAGQEVMEERQTLVVMGGMVGLLEVTTEHGRAVLEVFLEAVAVAAAVLDQ